MSTISWDTVQRYKTTLESGNATSEQLRDMVDQMNTYRSSTEYTNLFTSFNTALGNYVKSAGLNVDNSGNLRRNAQDIYNKIVLFQTVYILINQKLTELAKADANSASSNVSTIGTLQTDIINLKKDIKNLTNDLDTAKSRQSNFEESSTKFSYYQGFASRIGFTKPLKPMSVPILIASGLFFLLLVGLLFYDTFKPEKDNLGGEGVFTKIKDFFQDLSDSMTYDTTPKSLIIGLLIGFAIFTVIFIPLAYYGYLGKK